MIGDPAADFSWTAWDLHPSTVAGVAVLAACYGWFAGPLARRLGRPSVSARQVSAYLASLGVILAALNGPLHHLSDEYLFSAHMVQHLLLTLLVPPLFLAGLRGWMVDHVTRNPGIFRAARLLTRPVIAFAVPNAVLAAWHFPGPYGVAMEDHDVHIAMHLSMMVTAGMLWWPVLSPTKRLPRLGRPLQLLYLFALGLPMSLIGAMITLADHPLYEFYVSAPRLFGLSPLEDQRIGGLIMWVPGMLVFWSAMTVVWFRWSAEEPEDDGVRAGPVRVSGTAAPAE
ncbi:MAG TPA: cytochrome c oxidase assembly protein [Gemmatimonadales bacterium]|nr:cytochrome c oxidase assembly protein [Gemmatimonadales bacterium]